MLAESGFSDLITESVSLAALRYCLDVSRISFFDLVGGSKFRHTHLTTVFSRAIHQLSLCADIIYNFLSRGGVRFLPSLKAGVSPASGGL